MREIEMYIDRLYKNTSKRDNEYLKEEMKSHLYTTVMELKKDGFNEEESVKLAIERFGGVDEVKEELETVVLTKPRGYLTTIAFSIVGVVAFLIAIIFPIDKQAIAVSYNRISMIVPIIINYIAIRAIFLMKTRKIGGRISVKGELIAFTTIFYIVFLILRWVTALDYPSFSEVQYKFNIMPIKPIVDDFIYNISLGESILPIILSIAKQIGFYVILGIIAPISFKSLKNRNVLVFISILTVLAPIMLYYIFSFFGFTLIITAPAIVDYTILAIIGTVIGYVILIKYEKNNI